MGPRSKPPFRADHVGSLIRPDKLIKAREAAGKGEIAAAELTRIQHEAIREIVRVQQEIGFALATDGEFNRQSWQRDFLLKIGNVKPSAARLKVRFHSAAGTRDHTPASLQVVGKLSRAAGIFVDDFKFLAAVTPPGVTAKVTIPSPSIVHFRGGRGAVDARAYPQMDTFYEDLAAVYRAEIRDLGEAGCRYLQIDEVNLAYLCDPELRRQVADIGEDPEALPQTYARVLNDAIEEKPADMTVCMHLCRGNFAGAWIAEGGYEPVAELLFNEIGVDGYFLEYDSLRAGDFSPLRFLPKGKIAVLGLVTTKSPQLESKDELKRRIEAASRYAPLDQLALSPQCGFSSGIGGQAMTVADEIAKLKLVVETAREVWGEG